MRLRVNYLGTRQPASTVICCQLLDPKWKLEIEAMAAIYINLVEHPARLACGTELAARQWAPCYKRATVMQVPLAVVATLGGIAQWLAGGGSSWLLGALSSCR